jgi:hypothetical protein
LRIRESRYSIDSTFIDATGSGTYTFVNTSGPSDTNLVYNWLKNGPLALLMSIDYDPSALQTTGANYLSLVPVGLPETPVSGSSIQVFPNPASQGWVNFNFETTQANVLKIFAVDGKLVREENITGISELTLSTFAFSRGVYIYQVLDKNGTRMSAGRFAIVR